MKENIEEVKLEDLKHFDDFVGSYFDVTLTNGEGAAGIATGFSIQTEYRGFLGRWVYFDWGMQWFVPVGSKVSVSPTEPNS